MDQQLPNVDYKKRLDAALPLLDGGAMLVLAQPTAIRNSDVDHSYRQHSLVHYFTGFTEPNCALLVTPSAAVGSRYHLFVQERDKEAEIWNGIRLGVEGAKAQLAVDMAYPIKDLWEKVPELMPRDTAGIFCELGLSPELDAQIIAAVQMHRFKHRKHRHGHLPIRDVMEIASPLRQIKHPEEVARLRAAAEITRRTFAEMYGRVAPGMSEKQVHGIILGKFLEFGADMEAYNSIVAGGKNACILHYVENDKILQDGDLLLIDAGAQYHYYASDVTRTFPVGKKFSAEQRALYEIVLEAQKVAIEACVVSSNLARIHDLTVDRLVDGLISLKMLPNDKAAIIEQKTYRRFYPHGTSHWIGMDVHDAGIYHHGDTPIDLKPGMYFSVEPGLYVQPDDEEAPANFRGIGIRIEDDVLVTSSGPEVITAGIAKEIAELEDRN